MCSNMSTDLSLTTPALLLLACANSSRSHLLPRPSTAYHQPHMPHPTHDLMGHHRHDLWIRIFAATTSARPHQSELSCRGGMVNTPPPLVIHITRVRRRESLLLRKHVDDQHPCLPQIVLGGCALLLNRVIHLCATLTMAHTHILGP